MGFGDLRSDAGLTALNSFLADKSYIDGWLPSQADVVVCKALVAPPKEEFVHALRWYRHISSYSESDQLRSSQARTTACGLLGSASPISWPGVAKPLDQYGPAGATSSNAEDDGDFDLFGSDSEEESAEAERLKEERIAEYTAKKSKKPPVVAKSSIILDVKPWDDETDMADVERVVRSIEADGLLWGQAKLVPLAYGIKKLQIGCVVEDDKIGTDFLEEEITKFEDLVQSVDVAAFNKV